ncbi:MAG: hypothetical protein JWR90_1615 [Marmoricola sp.]|jgi:hypothetical protein|nr:hypothetical protein [Marmoricola sp.]
MSWWMLGAVCNAVIATAYSMIVFAIVRPLVKSGQLRTNPMGAATAAIFLTCAVHHGAHVVHMLMPYAGLDQTKGLAMRTAWGPELALWDLVGAAVGVYYWTLRGGFGPSDAGPQLFTDQHEREQRALELNDAVLQGMVVARLALDLGERRRGLSALDGSIDAASRMITELIGDDRGHLARRPLRSTAALVEHGPDHDREDDLDLRPHARGRHDLPDDPQAHGRPTTP